MHKIVKSYRITLYYYVPAPVAKLDKASVYEAGDSGFKSQWVLYVEGGVFFHSSASGIDGFFL